MLLLLKQPSSPYGYSRKSGALWPCHIHIDTIICPQFLIRESSRAPLSLSTGYWQTQPCISLILLISADVRSKVHQGWWDGSVSRGVHHWSWWSKFNVLTPHGRRKEWVRATCSLTSTHVQCPSERENTHAYTLVQNKSEATTRYSKDSILLNPLLPQYNSSIVSALGRVWVFTAATAHCKVSLLTNADGSTTLLART